VRADLPADKLTKLEAVLLSVGTPAEDIALIADLLAVPLSDRYSPLALSPQRKKERTLEALIRRLISRAHEQPVLMLFEDVHWADPSSLELLDTVIGLLSDLPILLVASFRPDFVSPWVGHANVTLIALNKLNRRQAGELAMQTMIQRALPPVVLERIVAQADGVPLFIEELTKAASESRERLSSSAPETGVPATLRTSLMARLDGLPVAKQVAQTGAVIGREFPHGLLAAIAPMSEAQIVQGLNELVGAGLAFRRGVPPDYVYMFKHALVQEAAYDSLLRTRRAEMHAAIVDAMESDPNVDALRAALLAHHAERAGLMQKAINYLLRASSQSATRSALTEAAAQLVRARGLIGHLPAGAACDRLASRSSVNWVPS
jgi:predicted ATPase